MKNIKKFNNFLNESKSKRGMSEEEYQRYKQSFDDLENLKNILIEYMSNKNGIDVSDVNIFYFKDNKIIFEYFDEYDNDIQDEVDYTDL